MVLWIYAYHFKFCLLAMVMTTNTFNFIDFLLPIQVHEIAWFGSTCYNQGNFLHKKRPIGFEISKITPLLFLMFVMIQQNNET